MRASARETASSSLPLVGVRRWPPRTGTAASRRSGSFPGRSRADGRTGRATRAGPLRPRCRRARCGAARGRIAPLRSLAAPRARRLIRWRRHGNIESPLRSRYIRKRGRRPRCTARSADCSRACAASRLTWVYTARRDLP
eukprot:scaffold323_cov414-Prasinococcus_capsulatus_cf.AAC.45